jgi:hypothetical protein
MERIMSKPNVPPNPCDDYPPSRPGLLFIAIVLLVVVVGFGLENWSDIRPQLPRIEAALHLYL